MMDTVSRIWFESESDNWFKRNKDALQKKADLPLFLLDLYSIKPQKALEIGCSNGYRLAEIHKKFSSQVFGVEPSSQAINDGRTKWPFIEFQRDLCESFVLQEKVDLIIVNFVLHWISRNSLFESVQNINNSLANNGYLILGDFGNESFIQRDYHHLPSDKQIFTYKQQYQNIFTSTGLYKEIAKFSFNCNTGKITSDIDNSNTGTVSLLKKSSLYINL